MHALLQRRPRGRRDARNGRRTHLTERSRSSGEADEQHFTEHKIHPNIAVLVEDLMLSIAQTSQETPPSETERVLEQIPTSLPVYAYRRPCLQSGGRQQGEFGQETQTQGNSYAELASPEISGNIVATTRRVVLQNFVDGPSTISASPTNKRAHLEWSPVGQNKGDAPSPAHSVADRYHSSNSSPSLATSRRHLTRSRSESLETQTRTPSSARSRRTISTPRSRGRSSKSRSRRNTGSNSPHTFGRPTPPRRGLTEQSASDLQARASPPPLPPLDHPAFRFAPQQVEGGRSDGPRGESRPTSPRHAHSLPAMTHTTSCSLEFGSAMGANLKGRRPKAVSMQLRRKAATMITEARRLDDLGEARSRKGHSRSKSTGSLYERRRLSAEYSAKKASSVGHEGESSQCWEVQVSRDIVLMALTGGPIRPIILCDQIGKTRGLDSKVAPGLGSPFLFQGSRCFPDSLSGDSPRNTSPSQAPVKNANSAEAPFCKYMSLDSEASKPNGPGSSSRRVEKSDHPPTRDSTRATSPHTQLTSSPVLKSIFTPVTLSIIHPKPNISSTSSVRRTHDESQSSHPSTPTQREMSVARGQKSPLTCSAKRKADEAGVDGGTPPKEQQRAEQHATFAVGPRPNRNPNSTGPSSYHRKKRARLSTTFESGSLSRSGTLKEATQNARSTGSLSSLNSTRLANPAAHVSRSMSVTSLTASRRAPSRHSLSQASIPLSALIAPHAPSVGRSTVFHMRDPRKPGPVQRTPWSLAFPSGFGGERWWDTRGWMERGGSPVHAWLFFLGFLFFPLWWVAAAFVRIPKTRRLVVEEAEKGVVLDDPQVEHDAKSWRFRCRVMAVVSLFTYVPFIVLLAIFARR